MRASNFITTTRFERRVAVVSPPFRQRKSGLANQRRRRDHDPCKESAHTRKQHCVDDDPDHYTLCVPLEWLAQLHSLAER